MSKIIAKKNTIDCQDVTIYRGTTQVIASLNWGVNSGEKWAILGENGCGKSTLLQAINHLINYHGSIKLNYQPLSNYCVTQLSREIGLLQQGGDENIALSVLDMANIACHHQLSNYQLWETKNKQQQIQYQLTEFQLQHKQHQLINTLSGGEYQRLKILMLILQDPKILLLDEPNLHLDIKHQMMLLSKLHTNDKTSIMAIHDLNLAYRFASHVLILFPDKTYICGKKEVIMTAGHLSKAFNYPITINQGKIHYG